MHLTLHPYALLMSLSNISAAIYIWHSIHISSSPSPTSAISQGHITPPISQCVKYVESKQWRHQNDAFETCNCQLGLDWKNQHHPDSNPSFKNCKNQSKYHGKINVKYSVLFCYPHPHSFYF